MINVYKPFITQKSIDYSNDALKSTWISSKGKYIDQVESLLSSKHKVGDSIVNSAISTNNGTSAVHLISKLLQNTFPKINKIIVPNNVYVAAWNGFLFSSKYQLIPVEADINTWNIDLDILYDLLTKTDMQTTALLIVHNLGNIVNVPKLKRDWKNLVVLEDNCEGFGGMYESIPSGSVSLASALSFFGNKNITSGEGGAVIAQTKYQGFLYKLRSQGQSETRFIHDVLGYNYRMTNIQAAILRGQLEDYEEIKNKKKYVFSLYKKLLKDVDEVDTQKIENNTEHSNWMFGVKIKNKSNFNDAESFFKSNYIEVRPMFYPINKHEYLKDIPVVGGSYIAECLNNQCVILPSYPTLKDHEVAHIVNTLKQYVIK